MSGIARIRIAYESWPFVLALAVLSVGVGVWIHPLAALPPVLGLVFTLWFFRDPQRTVPRDPQLLISPADGRIIRAAGGRISVFMNVFNVHVCRTPGAGEVKSVEHVAGRFVAAFREDAPEQNERTTIVVEGDACRVEFSLIAGLIARRIVCKVRPGQRLQTGERVGLIRFGSRVDVVLPPEARIEVAVGQHVRAGETVIARLG